MNLIAASEIDTFATTPTQHPDFCKRRVILYTHSNSSIFRSHIEYLNADGSRRCLAHGHSDNNLTIAYADFLNRCRAYGLSDGNGPYFDVVDRIPKGRASVEYVDNVIEKNND